MAIISLIHSHYLTMDSFFVHKQIDIFKALSLWLTQGCGLVRLLFSSKKEIFPVIGTNLV